MIAYKFLRRDGTSVFTGFTWPLPNGAPGEWVEAEVDPCRSGVHACLVPQLPLWVGQVLFEVDLVGDVVEEGMKVVAPRGRLVRRVETWTDELREEYTRMCADRGHELARAARLGDWETAIEPSIPEGPALLGFVAARIAEEASGRHAYHEERARQTQWLVKRLRLYS